MKKDIKSIMPEFITVDEALKFDEETTRNLQYTHLNKTRTILCNCKYFVKADDFTFYDEKGDKHLDFIGAVGVCTVGNNNPFVWNEIKKVVESGQFTMGVISLHNVPAAFAANMAKLSPGGKLTKMATATAGAEAIENALKLVKLATRDKPEKTHILSCEGAFHGKTTGAVTVGGKEKWRTYVTGLPTSTHDYVPFGDEKALEDALKKGIYKAFFFEPIQGENGIKVPPEGYYKKIRELCDKYDTLMVADEIQCGFARTGKMWCLDHEDVIPDVLVFAKGFSGGLIPFGGILAKEDVYNAAYLSEETAMHHTATYQENHLCAAAGNAAIQFVLENDLITAAAEKGKYMLEGLKKLQEKYPKIIKDVRGRGLMIGVEFFDVPPGKEAEFGPQYSLFLDQVLVDDFRIQVMFTINNPAVYRYLPPLTITKEAIDYCLESTDKAIQKAIDVIGVV